MSVIRTLGAAAAAVVLAFAAAPALAADPAPSARNLELATRLFDAMHMDRTMAQVTRSMGPTMAKQFETMAPQLTAAQRQAITAATNDMMTEMTGKLTAEMIPIYAQTFTEKELSDLLAFYQTPSGRAMLDKSPLVMERLQPTLTKMMPEMMTKFQKRMCAELGCPAK